MFGIFAITAFLEILVLIPGFYFVLQFVMAPTTAFILACLINLVTFAAIFICRFKPGPFIYKLITIVLSVLIALFAAGISIGSIIVAIMCLFIFSHVKANIYNGRDVAIQMASASIIMNIPLALIFLNIELPGVDFFGNAAIAISTVTSIIILVMKQVDDSRRFGKSSMGISNSQRRNNQIFAGIILTVLLLFSSFGHVTTIYKFVLRLIGRLVDLFASLLGGGNGDMTAPEQQMQDFLFNQGVTEPSLFEKIFIMILNILGTLIVVGFIALLVYNIFKFVIRMVIRLIKWFTSGEHIIEMVSENGHTDEKESLLDRNLKNLAHRFQNLASGIFKREVPYSKLPDDTSKVRRLMKYFISSARQSGVKVTNASTAQEICRDAGGISPAPEQINALLAECYDKARYDNTAPAKEQLRRLEQELLKH